MLAAVATALNDVPDEPQLAPGLHLTHSFYWNMDERSRRWSRRFFERTGAMPTTCRPGFTRR